MPTRKLAKKIKATPRKKAAAQTEPTLVPLFARTTLERREAFNRQAQIQGMPLEKYLWHLHLLRGMMVGLAKGADTAESRSLIQGALAANGLASVS